MADQKPPSGGKLAGGPPGGGKKPMGPPPPPASPDKTLTEIIIAVVVLIIVVPLLIVAMPSGAGNAFVDFLGRVFDFVKMVSTIISMIALVIVIYSFIRISEIVKEENKKLGLTLSWDSERTQKNVRWERVEQYMTSLNPSDWKIAILEADNILDDIVERIGYKGSTLGERLKNVEASDFPYLEEAWQAHKLRNNLAHKGTEYALSKGEADQAINIYHRIFTALGYL